MLVKFYHQDIHLLKQFAGAELMCIFDVGNIFIFIQPYFFFNFFFYERLQLHKIKRLRSLFHIYSYISNIVMYFYKSSDLGAQTPPILVIDVFRKGSLQQACKVTRLQWCWDPQAKSLLSGKQEHDLQMLITSLRYLGSTLFALSPVPFWVPPHGSTVRLHQGAMAAPAWLTHRQQEWEILLLLCRPSLWKTR